MTHTNKKLQLSLISSICIAGVSISTLSGCGAEIRPDGPKRVVFTESDGTQRVVQVAPSDQLRKAAIERLMLMTTDPSPEMRANAIEALSPVTQQVEPIVALAMSDPNAGVRSVALMVAGEAGLTSLTPTIREMVQDESPYVQIAALYALASFGEKDDLSLLSFYLLDHPDSRIRSQAAFVIGELGESSAIPMLHQASSNAMVNTTPNERKIFRLQVAEALNKLGHTESIDTIRAALYPSRPEELEATALAVQIIGQIRDEDSIDQLIYLSDPDSQTPMPAEVRLGVAYSLAQMGHREGSFVADEYINNELDSIRAQSAAVYGQTIGSGNLGKLERLMMNDPSPLTQVAAAGGIVDYTQRERVQSNAAGRIRD
jgi:HEAT repeat protein